MPEQPAMPSPARAADRSIALAIRLGVPKRQAPLVVARVCAAVIDRLIGQGVTDVDWVSQVARQAIAKSGQGE